MIHRKILFAKNIYTYIKFNQKKYGCRNSHDEVCGGLAVIRNLNHLLSCYFNIYSFWCNRKVWNCIVYHRLKFLTVYLRVLDLSINTSHVLLRCRSSSSSHYLRCKIHIKVKSFTLVSFQSSNWVTNQMFPVSNSHLLVSFLVHTYKSLLDKFQA